MTRLIRLELLKLTSTRLAPGIGAAAVALITVLTALQLVLATDAAGVTVGNHAANFATEASLVELLNVTVILALFTLVLGVTATSGEFRHATMTGTVLTTPRRHRVLAAKLSAYFLAGVGVALTVVFVLLGVVSAWLSLSGEPVPVGGAVAAMVVLTALAAGLACALGVGIGTALPNQLVAVLAAIGWVMVVEQLVAGLVPGTQRWLPFMGALSGMTAPQAGDLLAPLSAAVLMLGYVALTTVAGAVVLRRADIG